MAKINILHISDLQAGTVCLGEKALEESETSMLEESPGFLYERYAEKLALDALKTVKGKIDLLVCTGDIANKGETGEYKMTSVFFEKMSEVLNIGIADILIVPGNHDVNYGEAEKAFYKNNSKSIKISHENDDHLKTIKNRKMTCFKKWFNKTFKSAGYSYGANDIICFDKISNKHIAAVGLDTCDLQTFRKHIKEPGHVYENQLEQSRKCFSGKSKKVNLAIMHHNPFLDGTDNTSVSNAERVLHALKSQKVHLVLAGHMHQARAIDYLKYMDPSSNSNMYILVTGPCCMTHEGRTFKFKEIKEVFPNRYQIISLDRNAGKIDLYLRRFTFERHSEPNGTQGAWTSDTDIPYASRAGTCSLKCPEIRLIKKEQKVPSKIVLNAYEHLKKQRDRK